MVMRSRCGQGCGGTGNGREAWTAQKADGIVTMKCDDIQEVATEQHLDMCDPTVLERPTSENIGRAGPYVCTGHNTYVQTNALSSEA